MSKPLRKSLAYGERLAQYAAGGMVGRPAKKYVADMMPKPPAMPAITARSSRGKKGCGCS